MACRQSFGDGRSDRARISRDCCEAWHLMAGDWIKMRTGIFTHPKVVRMASALKADGRPDVLRVVGGLMSVWSLFDAHSVDGVLSGYTHDVIDDHLRWPGFSRAMEAVGWIESSEVDSSMSLPDFDTHNGQSAKRRAQDADRKRDVRKTSANEADKKRTREEKRREDKYPPTPLDEIVSLYHEKLPSLPAVRLKTEKRSRAVRDFWRWIFDSRKSDGEPRAKTAEQALAWVASYFDRAGANEWLMGLKPSKGHENWRADFDFLLTENGRKHVIERTVDQ